MDNEIKTITVCDECLRASCWQGYFMCEESQFAGIVEKTKEELIELNLEHFDYWEYDTVKSCFRRFSETINNG